jgi:hypothetical protein
MMQLRDYELVPPKRRKPAIRDSDMKSHGLINAWN